MLNISSRTWLLGGWMIVLALVVTISLSMAADFSTTVLLAALVVASGVVTAMLKRGAASQTASEILHPVNVQEGRR
jgi:hypothetical protein